MPPFVSLGLSAQSGSALTTRFPFETLRMRGLPPLHRREGPDRKAQAQHAAPAPSLLPAARDGGNRGDDDNDDVLVGELSPEVSAKLARRRRSERGLTAGSSDTTTGVSRGNSADAGHFETRPHDEAGRNHRRVMRPGERAFDPSALPPSWPMPTADATMRQSPPRPDSDAAFFYFVRPFAHWTMPAAALALVPPAVTHPLVQLRALLALSCCMSQSPVLLVADELVAPPLTDSRDDDDGNADPFTERSAGRRGVWQKADNGARSAVAATAADNVDEDEEHDDGGGHASPFDREHLVSALQHAVPPGVSPFFCALCDSTSPRAVARFMEAVRRVINPRARRDGRYEFESDDAARAARFDADSGEDDEETAVAPRTRYAVDAFASPGPNTPALVFFSFAGTGMSERWHARCRGGSGRRCPPPLPPSLLAALTAIDEGETRYNAGRGATLSFALLVPDRLYLHLPLRVRRRFAFSMPLPSTDVVASAAAASSDDEFHFNVGRAGRSAADPPLVHFPVSAAAFSALAGSIVPLAPSAALEHDGAAAASVSASVGGQLRSSESDTISGSGGAGASSAGAAIAIGPATVVAAAHDRGASRVRQAVVTDAEEGARLVRTAMRAGVMRRMVGGCDHRGFIGVPLQSARGHAVLACGNTTGGFEDEAFLADDDDDATAEDDDERLTAAAGNDDDHNDDVEARGRSSAIGDGAIRCIIERGGVWITGALQRYAWEAAAWIAPLSRGIGGGVVGTGGHVTWQRLRCALAAYVLLFDGAAEAAAAGGGGGGSGSTLAAHAADAALGGSLLFSPRGQSLAVRDRAAFVAAALSSTSVLAAAGPIGTVVRSPAAAIAAQPCLAATCDTVLALLPLMLAHVVEPHCVSFSDAADAEDDDEEAEDVDDDDINAEAAWHAATHQRSRCHESAADRDKAQRRGGVRRATLTEQLAALARAWTMAAGNVAAEAATPHASPPRGGGAVAAATSRAAVSAGAALAANAGKGGGDGRRHPRHRRGSLGQGMGHGTASAIFATLSGVVPSMDPLSFTISDAAADVAGAQAATRGKASATDARSPLAFPPFSTADVVRAVIASGGCDANLPAPASAANDARSRGGWEELVTETPKAAAWILPVAMRRVSAALRQFTALVPPTI